MLENNMNRADLDKILHLHYLWLKKDTIGVKADLSGANLYKANLFGADLRGANLSEANLSGANLSEANLSGAYLHGANLSNANLSEANLYKANLNGASLHGANLHGANLSYANLSKADLANIIGKNILVFKYKMHPAYYVDGYIHIGCEYRSVEDWVENYEKVGLDNDYTKNEISRYGDFISKCNEINRSLK
jgi:uncharacterized protein YjbI with pentapeptide repeats